MTVTVRCAREADFDTLVDLYVELKEHHARLAPHHPRYRVGRAGWERVVRTALGDPDVVLLVAEEHGRVTGFVKLSFVDKPWGRGEEIDTMVVADWQRGRGIGSRLLVAAEQHARRGRGARAPARRARCQRCGAALLRTGRFPVVCHPLRQGPRPRGRVVIAQLASTSRN